LVWFTDPLLADSDQGGRNDAAEVGRGDDPNDPSDDASCSYPTVDVPVTTPVTEPEQQPRPVWARFHWEGVLNGSSYEDSSMGSAQFVIELLDSTQSTTVCTLTYDLSDATAPHQVSPWVTEGGGAHWQPTTLTPGAGNSTCLGYNGEDLRDVIDGIPWGFALGPLDTLARGLEDDVTDAGGNWGSDWAPYVMGAYLHVEGGLLYEMGYAFTYDAVCDAVDDPQSASPLPAATDAVGDRFVVATGTRMFTVPELRTFAENATVEPYFSSTCLDEADDDTRLAGEGSCADPYIVDLTWAPIGETTTVQTGDLGIDEALASSPCTNAGSRDVVFRVIVPPGAGIDASVAHQGSERPTLSYIETGTCDGLVGGCADLEGVDLGTQVVINEVLTTADAFDANCDGAFDVADEQFVEIVNTGSTYVELGGATLSDGLQVLHTFAPLTLRPGDSVVVFGGGSPTFDGTSASPFPWCTSVGSMTPLVSDVPLDLDPAGASLTLSAANGRLLDTFTNTVELSGQSFVRSPEGDPTSPFGRHEDQAGAIGAVSPGTSASGVPFWAGSECDVLHIDDDDLVGHAALLVVSETEATSTDYTLTIRTY